MLELDKSAAHKALTRTRSDMGKLKTDVVDFLDEWNTQYGWSIIFSLFVPLKDEHNYLFLFRNWVHSEYSKQNMSSQKASVVWGVERAV